MDYQKLNARTEKDHFPMPFMDQIMERLSGKGWYFFLMDIRVIIRFGRSRGNHLNLSLWDFRVQENVVWVM